MTDITSGTAAGTAAGTSAGIARARRGLYRAVRRQLTAELRTFLDRHTIAVLATADPDGRIHAVPANYLFDDDGRFHIATSSVSRKARNAAARPEVTLTVDDRTDIAWVSAAGTADIVTGAASRALNDRIYRRAWGELAGPLAPVLHRIEDVTLTVTPHTWRSWDFRSAVLPALAAAGVPRAELESWFPSP
ncbi:pyridoxamine 5'-phosphate oxidase family protein [Streptomyces sp. YIM 98790]|uniref:pyridoxamine 5'-phosphate oxidase family protein n=1 Tax=Streptomyces sp. YIM 98790 TaxID=2689077 RepID=UPI00140B5643|nr:pyridoxamine 5'-phosphate oxidase family protein [Streptomyces sp. YIM 98790]